MHYIYLHTLLHIHAHTHIYIVIYSKSLKWFIDNAPELLTITTVTYVLQRQGGTTEGQIFVYVASFF